MWEGVFLIVKLVTLIFGSLIKLRDEKAKENQSFKLEMKQFEELVKKSLQTMRQNARQDSSEARDIEDQVDEETSNKPKIE